MPLSPQEQADYEMLKPYFQGQFSSAAPQGDYLPIPPKPIDGQAPTVDIGGNSVMTNGNNVVPDDRSVMPQIQTVGNPAKIKAIQGLFPGNPAATQKGLEGYASKIGENAATGSDPDTAKNNLQKTLTELDGLYDQLHDKGASVEAGGPVLGNASNFLAATGPGQLAGKLVGTERQSILNQIAAKRPLIMAQLKNATGMSAQQMNSNAELSFYLDALSNPTDDYQANKKNLSDFAGTFGTSKLNSLPKPTIQAPINYSNPLVQKAKQSGYSDAEIADYLKGRK